MSVSGEGVPQSSYTNNSPLLEREAKEHFPKIADAMRTILETRTQGVANGL
jgi:hypothetical protein